METINKKMLIISLIKKQITVSKWHIGINRFKLINKDRVGISRVVSEVGRDDLVMRELVQFKEIVQYLKEVIITSI